MPRSRATARGAPAIATTRSASRLRRRTTRRADRTALTPALRQGEVSDEAFHSNLPQTVTARLRDRGRAVDTGRIVVACDDLCPLSVEIGRASCREIV